MNEGEKNLKRLYQDMLRDELKRPEVQKEKKSFLHAHFEPRPFFARSGFFVPAFGFAAVFLLVLLVHQPVFQHQSIPKMEQTPTSPLQDSELEMVVSETSQPLVEVKRVTSHVGPTMVYQKLYHNVPVTIVWVFTGEKSP